VTSLPHPEYAGFWRRGAALVLDLALLSILSTGILYLLYGQRYLDWLAHTEDPLEAFSTIQMLVDYLLPLVLVVGLWVWVKATPGKFLLGCQVVDARTGRALRPGQAVLRYLGYTVSSLTFGLGFLWMLWDRRRQTLHDKLARSVVVIEDEALRPLADWLREFA
jgi:uncharacterized RDD family membrane protein YckC